MPDGAAEGNMVQPEKILPQYYGKRGWDELSGVPKEETINRLGMGELVKRYQ